MFDEKVEWVYEASDAFVSKLKKQQKQLEQLEQEMKTCYTFSPRGTFGRSDRVLIGNYTFQNTEDNQFVMVSPGSLFEPKSLFKDLSSKHEGKHVLTRYQRGTGKRYVFVDGNLLETSEQKLFEE